jgi:glycerol-3-phosphate O-acyltransferase/dihydroxyacetone phosphate acyltransferase
MLRNPILFSVYYFLYGLVKTLLVIYYRPIRTEGFPSKEPTGPLIILSNHPNALMDPLVIVSQFRRPVYFLANAGMFRHPFANWFLNTFFCIPIERPKDVGRPLNNADSFRRSREHLESGGALFIAPEGTCFREYRVRPLRTGTARIALDLLRTGRVKEVNFLLAGINYSDPPSFRSQLMVRFAPIITLRAEDLKSVKGDWEEVTMLTDRLHKAMTSLVPHTTDELDEQLSLSAAIFRPVSRKANWAKTLYQLRDQIAKMGSGASEWVNTFQHILLEEGITSLDPAWLKKPFRWFPTVVGAPLAIWVLFHHMLIFGLPELLRRLAKVDKVYDATVRYMSGMISYPLGIFVLHVLLKPFLGDGPWLWPYILLILFLGPWSWQIGQSLADLKSSIHFRSAMLRNPVWAERVRQILEPLSYDAT